MQDKEKAADGGEFGKVCREIRAKDMVYCIENRTANIKVIFVPKQGRNGEMKTAGSLRKFMG